jgi:hypothetical protein
LLPIGMKLLLCWTVWMHLNFHLLTTGSALQAALAQDLIPQTERLQSRS